MLVSHIVFAPSHYESRPKNPGSYGVARGR